MDMSAVGAIRFETRSQGGKAQIFWEKDRNQKKTKKVNYKTKEQKFPIRKGKQPAAVVETVKPTKKNTQKQQARNKSAETKPKASPAGSEIKPGTVTLTQDQLSAILTSIVKVAKDNPLHISIDKETNEIKVEEEKAEESQENEENKDDADDDKSDGGENIMNLLMKDDKEPTQMTESASLKPASRLGSSNASPVPEKTTVSPPRYLTVAEKKRLQWETEKAELAKAEANSSSPWGRPGAGAPIRDIRGDVMADFNTRKDVNQTSAASKNHQQKSPTSYQKILDAVSPRDEKSLHTQPRTTSNKSPPNVQQPSAIRSSFIVGELAPQENRYNSVKEEEKKRWLEELESQREELRLKREKEKQSLRAKEIETWADKLKEPTRPAAERISLSPPAVATKTVEQVEQSRVSSAPNDISSMNNAVMESMTFIRGQNIHLDALTLHELQESRIKHLEHQKAIQAQVEEKQRLKREEREKRIREEREEERKLQLERDLLQTQFNLEQEKQRKKEEEQNRRVQVLKDAMEEAQEKAAHEKHLRRLNDLQKRGHDISHLHKSFEASHTPRTAVNAESSHNIPGLNLRATVNLDSASVPLEQIPVLNKVVDLSPRKEFGTQTDENIANLLSSASYPNMSHVSTREDSAHIQFKGQEILKNETKKTQQNSNNKSVRVKSADTVKSHQKKKNESNKRQQQTVTRQQDRSKMLWNYQNRHYMRPLKNSEKDPNYMRRKKEIEARRAQREQELIKLTEANKNMIPVDPHERISRRTSAPKQKTSERSKSEKQNHAAKTKQKTPEPKVVDHHRVEHSPPPPAVSTRATDNNYRSSSPPVPAVKHRLTDQSKHKYGADEHLLGQEDEFVPFLRSSAFLDPSESQRPLAVSREATVVERGRKAYARGLKPGDYGHRMNNIHDQDPESVLTNRSNVPKDPLINPNVVQEHPTPRQEIILKQLQDIRKNLLQRQREIETSISPSDLNRVYNDD